jgi:hypothetical protein
MSESKAKVTLDVEEHPVSWAPIDPYPTIAVPDTVLFVDGVRRIDARIWIDSGDITSSGFPAFGICASYAAGVVCCCGDRAHVIAAETRRGVFTPAESMTDIVTKAGCYKAWRTTVADDEPLAVVLSSALQRQLADVEIAVAIAARSGSDDHAPIADDLLVVDGPLHDRTHIERIVGYIKSHESAYLPFELNAMVGRLATGQRTPVFRIRSDWDRYSWYLRLPCQPGPPWAGIVRLEAPPTLSTDSTLALANLTQRVLGRYASDAYKDSRAPQNLYPIGGLERYLRHRLGDQRLVYRGLRMAAAETTDQVSQW